MAAAVVAALLAIVGIGYLIFGDDTPDEVTADQQIASNNTDMSEEEPTGSEKDMQKADDEEEASEESDDNTSSDPPEKALADSDKGDTNEGEDADSVAHFTDNCQLKRQHGNDVGMVMSNNAQNGVVLECDDGLYTAQARVRNGNVEIKTSTLQPFDGDVEDILYVKRSQ